MSSYNKLIIFVLVLVIISAAVVLIDSSVDSINKTMPGISDSIVNGDNDYNDAVELVNDKNFEEGMAKAESAGNHYNDSYDKLTGIREKFSSDINDVQDEYFETVLSELELKIQAVGKLEQAIECFEVYSNYTGTNYASEANDLIYDATKYQDERDEIVKDNPNLFK